MTKISGMDDLFPSVRTWYRLDDAFGRKLSREVTYDVPENYLGYDHWIKFDKLWNNLIQSESQPDSLTRQYTDE